MPELSRLSNIDSRREAAQQHKLDGGDRPAGEREMAKKRSKKSNEQPTAVYVRVLNNNGETLELETDGNPAADGMLKRPAIIPAEMFLHALPPGRLVNTDDFGDPGAVFVTAAMLESRPRLPGELQSRMGAFTDYVKKVVEAMQTAHTEGFEVPNHKPEKIKCGKHGQSYPSLVCRHVVSGAKVARSLAPTSENDCFGEILCADCDSRAEELTTADLAGLVCEHCVIERGWKSPAA
jgi:hypothetical protein